MIITFGTPDYYNENERYCHFIDTDYSACYQNGMPINKLKTFLIYLIYNEYDDILNLVNGSGDPWIWEVIYDIEWGPSLINDEELFDYIDNVDNRAIYHVIVDHKIKELTIKHVKRPKTSNDYLYYDSKKSLLNGWTKIKK